MWKGGSASGGQMEVTMKVAEVKEQTGIEQRMISIYLYIFIHISKVN